MNCTHCKFARKVSVNEYNQVTNYFICDNKNSYSYDERCYEETISTTGNKSIITQYNICELFEKIKGEF